MVSARVSGVLDAIYVDEGDPVEAGKTRLFQTDSLNLKRSEEVAEQQLSVAEHSLKERLANLDQVQARVAARSRAKMVSPVTM